MFTDLQRTNCNGVTITLKQCHHTDSRCNPEDPQHDIQRISEGDFPGAKGKITKKYIFFRIFRLDVEFSKSCPSDNLDDIKYE